MKDTIYSICGLAAIAFGLLLCMLAYFDVLTK